MKYEGNICPNCFDTAYDHGECLKCGYRQIYDQSTSRGLPWGAILNNRYIIGKVLGEGGFGITYKACDLKGGGICAIKEYAPAGMSCRQEDGITLGLATQREAACYEKGLKRFIEEAQILHRLGDIPSVVRVLECFRENQTAYFAMEYLDGANLNQIVRAARYQLPFEEVTNIIIQVGRAMDRIHKEARIFHRDISPENIYITKDKQVKLIDFGSAKETELPKDQEYSVVLKLKFAPPEQHSSRMKQGTYTDVYALAGTYYYTLTGLNLPTAVDRLSGETYVPLKQMNMGIPDYVSDAVDRALELNYQKRTQTMEEFVNEITANRPQAPICVKQSKILPYLEVVSGRMIGTRWNLPAGVELRIGRSRKENHITIQGHQEISKIHCYVYYDEPKDIFYVKDVSRNGTFVNGQRLERNQVYPVKPSSNIALSSAACVVKLGVRLVNIKEG